MILVNHSIYAFQKLVPLYQMGILKYRVEMYSENYNMTLSFTNIYLLCLNKTKH